MCKFEQTSIICAILIYFGMCEKTLQNISDIKCFDLIFSEIMMNPNKNGTSLYPEYIELFNRTSHDIILRGFSLRVGSKVYNLPETEIKANGFLLITTVDNNPIPAENTPILAILSRNGLNNTGQRLYLDSGSGKTITWVNYSSSWHTIKGAGSGGYSLELADIDNPCGGAKVWRSSENSSGGTPGYKNSVSLKYPDITPPEVYFCGLDSENSVLFYFSESLSTDSDFSRWERSDGEYPVKETFVSEDFKIVRLIYSTPHPMRRPFFITPTAYTKDCTGNAFVTGGRIKLEYPAITLKHSIILNEILPYPLSGGAVFVEVYNASESVVDISKIKMEIAGGSDDPAWEPIELTGNSLLLYPKEYIVFTPNPDALAGQYTECNIMRFLPVSFEIPRNAGHIRIVSSEGVEIDRVSYGFDSESGNINRGVSIERLTTDPLSNIPWLPASGWKGYATPGVENSQKKQDKETESVFYTESDYFSPNGDLFMDELDIKWRVPHTGFKASIEVFDIKGRKIKTLIPASEIPVENKILWDGRSDSGAICYPGTYILLFRAWDRDGKVLTRKKAVALIDNR